jgi:thymidylate synthase (FAD)
MSHEITLTSDITVRRIQEIGGDHMVVAAAKVSVCGEDALKFSDPACVVSNSGLINFLMEHRHGTPFEHGSMTFFVHAPIFVWREWHRHRIGFSFNEESARFKPLNPTFWIPRRDRRMVPVEGWKPGRPKFRTIDEAIVERAALGAGGTEIGVLADAWYAREVGRKRKAYEVAYSAYRESIDDGIAMEVARSVLPVGIYSSCWVTCNPRSLMAFLSLRTHDPEARFVSYPQAEIEEAARVSETFLAEGWPITYAAFVKQGRVGP